MIKTLLNGNDLSAAEVVVVVVVAVEAVVGVVAVVGVIAVEVSVVAGQLQTFFVWKISRVDEIFKR